MVRILTRPFCKIFSVLGFKKKANTETSNCIGGNTKGTWVAFLLLAIPYLELRLETWHLFRLVPQKSLRLLKKVRAELNFFAWILDFLSDV